ncbi:30S ribosomal protein S17 [Candidatus Peregrinibacteria bacterium]|nr:30S ribosomal protein S17 [Candidatus Peregrinibacteria bacterium]
MRTKVGTITAAKMTDTVTVTVHRSVFHPLYRKRYRVSKKFLADTKGMTDLGIGDTVEITECRPISKRKFFKITHVVKRVPRVSDLAEEGAIERVMRKRHNKDANDAEGAKSTSSDVRS